MMRTISVPAGIGDSIWLFMKLINTKESFSFNIPDGKPQRSKQVFDLLPQVVAQSQYVPGLSYNKLARENIQNIQKNWKQILARRFSLSMNQHLESGQRIEKFLPDLPTSFILPWQTESYATEVAKDLPNGPKYIGIYGSSYSTTRAWGFWGAIEWFELIQNIHILYPDTVFIIIGAAFDMDLAGDLAILLTKSEIPFISTVGKPIGYVGELMKILSFAFYFPSGLPIFSESLGACDCLMFYAPQIEGIKGNWASPDRIGKNFHEMLFDTPENVFTWYKKLNDNYEFASK